MVKQPRRKAREHEEFLFGHKHVFSLASYALLIANAGFELLTCERLQPSTKFTLRGFRGWGLQLENSTDCICQPRQSREQRRCRRMVGLKERIYRQ